MRRLQEASSRLHAGIRHAQEAQGRNFICSPVSALLVFLMVMRGARGPTYEEMQSFLGVTQMPALPFPDRPPVAGLASPERPTTPELAGPSGRDRESLPGALRQGGKKKKGKGGRKHRPGKRQSSSPERRRSGPGDFEYTVFNLAARLYVSETTKSTRMFQAYQESVREATHDKAGVHALDFTDGPQAEQAVNAFVAQATENHIQQIISPGIITPHTRLLAVSAAFFGSRWKTHFDKDRTRRKPFYAPIDVTATSSRGELALVEERELEKHSAPTDSSEEEEEKGATPWPAPSSEMQLVKQMVSTMFVEIENPPFYVQETSNYVAVGLPYTDPQFVMFVVMPRDPKNLPLLTGASHKRQELGLEDTHFPHVEEVIQDMKRKARTLRSVHLQLHMPKFFLKAQDNSVDLKTVFAKKLGVPTPFNPGDADFEGIDGGKEQLYISDFLHAGEIEVDERGTRASGATAVTICARCLKPPAEKKIHFRVNRPFYFQIRYLGRKLELVSDDDDEHEWEAAGSHRQGPGSPSREKKGAPVPAFFEEEDDKEDVVLFSGEVYDAAAAQS